MPTPTPVRHYCSILKINVARCIAVRNVTRLARLRKFFHLSFSWSFSENLRTDMLLKLVLNLFSRRKRFKHAKICLSCLSISTSFFIRHLTTRQGSSVKNRPLIFFVDYLNNVSINILINSFIIILKKIWNETWKNDIIYILAVFLSINSVEYLSVLTSFYLVLVRGSLFSFANNFFYRSWSYDKTYDAWCSLCAILIWYVPQLKCHWYFNFWTYYIRMLHWPSCIICLH